MKWHWPLRKHKRKFLFLVFLLTALTLAGGGLYLFHRPIFQALGAFVVYEDQPKPCDLICVLGGGGYVRLEKGISLYKEGYAPQLFFALPEIIPHGTPYGDLIDQEKTICKAILEYRDVPASDVLWSKKIFFSTFEEITYIKGLLEEKSLQSAIIVPGWFQSRRAKWTVDTIIGSQKEILIVPAPEDSFDTREWWKDMDGFIMVENELMKNLYYFFKY